MITKNIFADYLKNTKKILIDVPEVNISLRPSRDMLTALANINSLGFEVTDSVYKKFLSLDSERDKFNEFYEEIMDSLRLMKGGDHDFEPFYKNFPEETLNMTDEEFYWNAFKYYFGMAVGIPEETMQKVIAPEKNPRFPFMEKPDEYIKIGVSSVDEYLGYIKSICESKANMSKGNETSLKVFFDEAVPNILSEEELCDFLKGLEPQNKQNACIKNKLIMDSSLEAGNKLNLITRDIKTTTDVLRLFVYSQTGEADIRINPVQTSKTYSWLDEIDYEKVVSSGFRTVGAAERRLFLGLLENVIHNRKSVEEMWAHADLWKKVSYRLKPGKYMDKYPKAFSAINELRNEKKPVLDEKENLTKAFQDKNTEVIEEIFKKNPGIMLQNAEKYLEIMESRDEFGNGLKTLTEILDSCDKKELNLRLMYREFAHCYECIHMLNSDKTSVIYDGHGSSHRSFKKDKVFILDDRQYHALQMVLFGYLQRHTRMKDPLGNVYITPEATALLKNIKAPMNLKNINPSIRNLSEGSRIPINESDKDLYRLFTQWHNLPGKPHSSYCDMHVILLDEDGKFIDFVGWNGRSDSTKKIFNYSGDMCAPSYGYGDVVTYTDIDMKALADIKYIEKSRPKSDLSDEEKAKIKALKKEIRHYSRMKYSVLNYVNPITDECLYEVSKALNLVPIAPDAAEWNREKVKDSVLMRISEDIAARMDKINEIQTTKVIPRYAVVAVENWSGNLLNTVQCQTGVILRKSDEKQRGEVFEAGSVKDTFNLTCAAQNVVTFGFDLKDREMIWVNKPYGENKGCGSPAEQPRRNAAIQVFNGVREREYVTMKDVIMGNVCARGQIVSDIKEADTIITTENMDLNNGQTLINIFEPSLIAAEFLDDKFRADNILRFSPKRQIEIIDDYLLHGEEEKSEKMFEVIKNASEKLPDEQAVIEYYKDNLHFMTEEELTASLEKAVKELEKSIGEPEKVDEFNVRIKEINKELKSRKYPSHTHEIQAAMSNPLGNNSKARAKDKEHDERG